MSYMPDTSSICCWLSGMTRAGQRKEEEDKFSEKDDWFGVFWREKANFDYNFKRLDKELLFYPGENPYLRAHTVK